jgi:PKD repeat protein
MTNLRLALGAIGALLGCASALSAQGILRQTLPLNFETREGNTAFQNPWGASTTSMWHFVYDTTNFLYQQPIRITKVSWRPDRTVTGTYPGGSFPAVEVVLGSSRNDWANATYDPAFANNYSGDEVTFFNGPLVVPGGAGGAAPNLFDIQISNATGGFVYDPSQGRDLFVQLRIPIAPTQVLWAMDAHSGGGIRATRYGRNASATSTTWNTSSGESAPILEIEFLPANGLIADFSATPTVGPSPLNVQFTDRSATSGFAISAWAWDFNGDSLIDSNQQNPSFIYSVPGSYNVSLTVTESGLGQAQRTKSGYIVVDPVPVASFGTSGNRGATPFTVSFRDTSTNNPTSWAWDLDGDNVVDSTVQNPTFVYGTPGTFNVTLRATNIGGTGSITKNGHVVVTAPTNNSRSAEILHFSMNESRGIVSANAASTPIAPPSATWSMSGWQADPGRVRFQGNEPGAGCVKVMPFRANGPVLSTGWATNLEGSYSVMWWQRLAVGADPSTIRTYAFGSGVPGVGLFGAHIGSVAGNSMLLEGSPFGDVQGSQNLISNLGGVWVHVALVVDDANGVATWYADGVPDTGPTQFTPGTNRVIEGTSFLIGSRAGTTGGTYTAFFEMDDFRLYGRALTTAEIVSALAAEAPTATPYGNDCAGPAGAPVLSSNTAPFVPNPNFALQLSGAEANRPALLVIGLFQRDLIPGLIQLPFPLPFLGANCGLETTLEVQFPGVTSATGTFTIASPLPGGPSVRGRHAYAQMIILGSSGAATKGLDVAFQ